MQQPDYIDSTESELREMSTSLTKLPSTAQSDEQWKQIGTQVSEFFAQLPDYLGRFFNTYKQPLINVALILAAIILLRVILAVLNALNGIPLLKPTFELIGIGYTVWFVNRYLLKTSNRQELSSEIETLKDQVAGN